ncbi:MAG: hypothetical protein LRY66_05915 [Saccharospirillaceae bacterium]|nr:hypothetical protein [Saccharospirillaceae bacterium]MCD8530891.1 hypothetical protein [Saccharospirillaceae bacterium]
MAKKPEAEGSRVISLLRQKKLNMTEAADVIGVSLTTFKRWKARGDLPRPINIGGKERWLESDMEQWLLDQNPHLRDRMELERQARVAIMKQREILRQRGVALVGD